MNTDKGKAGKGSFTRISYVDGVTDGLPEVRGHDGVCDAPDLGGEALRYFVGVEEGAVADELVTAQEAHL